MRFFGRKAAAVAIAVLLTVAAAGCGGNGPVVAEPAAVEAVLVKAVPAERGSLELTSSFTGTIRPAEVVNVMPKSMGTVEKVHVTTGQTVKKGDLLMTLDKSDAMPSYRQAEAAYNSAKASVDQMTGSSYKSSLANLDASFDSAYDNYETARARASSAEDALNAAKADLAGNPDDPGLQAAVQAAAAAYDAADSAAELARKYYNNARNSYNAMKVEGTEELQAVADATLAQAEAGLALAKQSLDNMNLYAPIDGIIESIGVTELNPVSTSAPAFVISNKASYSVTFNVSEAAASAMEVGDSAVVERSGKSYNATITDINSIVNAQTGLFDVKASIDAGEADIKTNVTVKINAVTKKADNEIILPVDSVYSDSSGSYVYLAGSDGLAVKVYVETGISNEENIVVTKGINDGDMVITSWSPKLADGLLIKLSSEEE